MLRHYLKFFIRYFRRNILLSSVNILGLCIGLASSVFILLFIINEFSYDKFHAHIKNIVKVYASYKGTDGSDQYISGLSDPFAAAVSAANPGISDAVRIKNGRSVIIRSDKDHIFNEENYLLTDPHFFTIFSFPLVSGNPSTVLEEPNSIVVTEETARKYFNTTDVLGKTLTVNDTMPLRIACVVKKPPPNSSLDFDFLLPLRPGRPDAAYETFLWLNDPHSIGQLTRNINEQFKDSRLFKAKMTFSLVPFRDLHLHAPDGDGSEQKNIYIFSCIGIIILALSIINYLSLSISFSFRRARETAIRRFLGSGKKELGRQFLVETLCLFGLAFLVSIILFVCLSGLLYRPLDIQLAGSFTLYALAFSIVLLLFIAGLIGASSVNSRNMQFSRNKMMRSQKILTVFQFFVSQTLIICALLARDQMTFVRHKDIGLTKNNVMVVPLDPSMVRTYNAFKHEIGSQSDVSGVTAATLTLFKRSPNLVRAQKQGLTEYQDIQIVTVDDHFFKTLGLQWSHIPADPAHLTTPLTAIVNEEAMHRLDLYGNNKWAPIDVDGTRFDVLGVIKDFNISSLKNRIEPMIITVGSDSLKAFAKHSGSLYIHFNDHTDIHAAIDAIAAIYRKYQPEKPFQFYFLDTEYQQLYMSESRLSRLFNIFTILSIFLACLGLFALISMTAKNKVKEIGIRKVLGASIASIMLFVSKDTLKIMILAIFLAWPISYLVIARWLKDFAYRTDIKLTTFVIASLLMCAITIATIAYQLVRSSFVQPVRILKNE